MYRRGEGGRGQGSCKLPDWGAGAGGGGPQVLAQGSPTPSQIKNIHLHEKDILTGFDAANFPESFFSLPFSEVCTFFIWLIRM